jgi:hypothetical protein
MIQWWIDDRGNDLEDDYTALRILAETTARCNRGRGLSVDLLYQIHSGRKTSCSFESADAIVCALGNTLVWFTGPLAEYYPPMLTCARRNCNNPIELETIPHQEWKGGKDMEQGRRTPRGPQDGQRFTTRKFCSDSCCEQEGRYRRGVHVPKSDTHFRCGHEKTPENTARAGKYTRCRTCAQESVRRWRERVAA